MGNRATGDIISGGPGWRNWAVWLPHQGYAEAISGLQSALGIAILKVFIELHIIILLYSYISDIAPIVRLLAIETEFSSLRCIACRPLLEIMPHYCGFISNYVPSHLHVVVAIKEISEYILDL